MIPSALGLIGNTRLIELCRIHRGPGRIVAKAEFLQPGGSIKDRAALAILEGARREGRLRPGQPVVEMTSGNMGAGLAVVAGVMGHPLTVTMSAGNSPQRAAMMEGLGARVVLVPQVDGVPGQVTGADVTAAIYAARQIAEAEGAYYVDQFHNPHSVRAHEEGTGPELWAQLGGRVDAFVACVGTGGTFTGVARFLKRQRREIVCAAVEPEGAEMLAGKPVSKARHTLQGTGYGAVPPQWDFDLMDLSIAIGDSEAAEGRRQLAHREGLHVGYSSAANVLAASRLLESGRLARDAVVATVLCDTGLKY
jgi:cysteine synthase A